MQKEISDILTLSMTASIFSLSYSGLMFILPGSSLLLIPNTALAAIIATSAAITDGTIYGNNINQGISRFLNLINSENESFFFKSMLIASLSAAAIGAALAVASSAYEAIMIIYPSLIFSSSISFSVHAAMFLMSTVASASYFFVFTNAAIDLINCKENHIHQWISKLSNFEFTYDYLWYSSAAILSSLYAVFTFSAWNNKLTELSSFLPFLNPLTSYLLTLSFTFWESLNTFGNVFNTILENIDSKKESHESDNHINSPVAKNTESNYERIYNKTIKPIVFWTHTIGEACVISAPGSLAFISTFTSFITKNIAEFNQLFGGEHHHHHDHEHEHHEHCAFGHSHEDNPIDYFLCELPKKTFRI